MGGCVNVPGTCVWKMMLRYKYVLLEVASLISSFVTAQFAENMFFWKFERQTVLAIACLASGLVPDLGSGRHMFYM